MPKTFAVKGIYCIFVLSRQGSNLDSSEPKSDVLPVTLRDSNSGGAKLNFFLLCAKQEKSDK